MVRDAKFVDVPAIVLFLHRIFDRTVYASKDIGQIDDGEAKKLLMQAIHRHGDKQGGSCFVQVSERDGAIEGLIVGTLARVYSIGTKLMATDLFWLASEDVPPADPYRMIRNMVEWAKACPDVVEIKCGTSSVITGNPDGPAIIMERLGLERVGTIWRADVKDLK